MISETIWLRRSNRQKKMKTFVVVLFVCTLARSFRTCHAKPELQLLSIVFRHGDRTPNAAAIFPTDPNYHNDFFPIGHGGLTNSGKLRMYELGQFLREKYKDFLGDIYYPELVSARSTDYTRTKMSLQLVLAALFPPSRSQKWHRALNWQPVQFAYVPKPDDDLLATTSKSRYLTEKNRVTMLPEIQARFEELSEFMSRLTKLTGKNITGSFDITQIYDTLLSEHMMNLTLPSWAAAMFPDGELHEAALLFYDIITHDDRVTETLAGKLMLKIQRDMLALKGETKERRTKLFMYSAHETNIVGVLKALRMYDTHLPFYSSAVIMELWKDVDYYVKVLYYPGNSSSAVELKLPGCPNALCPLDKYTSNVKPILELAVKHETH